MLDTVSGEPFDKIREDGSGYIFKEKYEECVLELDMMSML